MLEHPEASHAFRRFGLRLPPKTGGWVLDARTSMATWTCCVEQGHYDHPARKATWLYYVGERPPELIWGVSSGQRLDEGFHSKAERLAAREAGRAPRPRLSNKQNTVTPVAFAELLIGLAQRSRPHFLEGR